jgi:hypothetical protein
MSNYDNSNSGVLFKNDRKEKSTHPDYKGTASIDGQEYWLSAWIKTAGPQARNPGQKFLSLAFDVKETPRPPVNNPSVGDEDDIPF